MSRTLPEARQAFIAAMQRDTPGTDLPRYVAVLDALIAWSAERADRLTFRAAETRPDVIRFARAGTKEVLWSAQLARGGAPKLEIHLAAGRPMGAEDRATAMATLNAHSREVLEEGDRLRIGFGALKNAAALQAVLAMMAGLLENSGSAAGR